MYSSTYADSNHCWMVSNSHSNQWKKANDMHRQSKLFEMKSWSRTRFIFYQWLEGMSCEQRLRMLCLSGLEKRLEMTDLMRSRCYLGFLIIGLWCLGKGWAHTWAFPWKVFLLAAYFHTNKDILSVLLSVPLGIIQLERVFTGEGSRERDRQAYVQGVIIGLGNWAKKSSARVACASVRNKLLHLGGPAGAAPSAYSRCREMSQMNHSFCGHN